MGLMVVKWESNENKHGSIMGLNEYNGNLIGIKMGI